MEINRLKKGQLVWVFNGEFEVEEAVSEVDLSENVVWLSDGNAHKATEVYSSKQRCKDAH